MEISAPALYALKQAALAAGTLSSDTVLGVASLIFWALILVISIKYAILILRADNHGEGGIVAMLALLDARQAPPRSWRASLLIVGLIGAALLYGDGVITPAISVLSAVEGLKVDAPQLSPAIVPLTLAILIGSVPHPAPRNGLHWLHVRAGDAGLVPDAVRFELIRTVQAVCRAWPGSRRPRRSRRTASALRCARRGSV